MNSNHLLQVENLDHLGLVAGIIDEIGIVEQINQLLGQHETERVSAGQVVKAMILNGLGFVSAPLYIFSKFFEGKATEHLIGEGVKPEHLEDAIKAASELSQQLKYYCLSDIITIEADLDKTKKSKRGQPSGNSFYQIQASVVRDTRAIESEMRCAGRFVLATNVLNISCLSNDEMLAEYKAQQGTERGFGFLKDPLFFTDSVFLKSPERVSALALVMGLCLLVYTLAQRQLRLALEQTPLGIKNQLGKLTRRPTLRWVFQCFQAVHLITIDGIKQIVNLTPERLDILRFFPPSCRHYYLLY
jgi:transposase